MMRLPSFRFEQVETIQDAAALLAKDPENTRLVAGGTDLWPNLKRRHQQAETVVSLAKIPGLVGIDGDGKGETTIGAMTSLTEIAESEFMQQNYPGVARAVGSISAPVLRNMGTIGGNLCLDTRCTYYNQNEEWRRSIDYCMKEKGSTCWVAPTSSRCWAISATDAAPILCAIGAQIELVSVNGTRTMPLVDLYQDDGIDYLLKKRDEILTKLILPAPATWKSTYWKLRRRGSIDFPVLGVSAALKFSNDGSVEDARIFLGAVRSAPTRCEDSEQAIIGAKLDDASVAAAGIHARKASSPLDNTDFVVNWRKKMVERYVEGVLRELGGLPETVKAPPHGSWATAETQS